MKRKRILLLLAVIFGFMLISVLAVAAYSLIISRPLFDAALAPNTLDSMLAAGDKVVIRAERMGILHNTITD